MATSQSWNSLPLHDFPGGVANSAGAIESSVAGTVFGWRSYSLSSAVSGSSYGSRFQHYLTGAAGSGAAVRAYGLVKGVTAANLYGLEATAEIMSTTSSGISGEASAIVASLAVNGTASGTLSVLNLTSAIANGKDASGGTNSYIQISQVGTGTHLNALFNIAVAKGTTSATTLTTTNHDVQAADTYIRILINGVAHWILATTHVPA